MKPLLFTLHGVEAVVRRKLSTTWIVRTVREPDWTAPDPIPGVERRFKRLPEYGGRVLRVVVVEEADHIRVLSAHPDRNARPPDAP